VKKRNEPKVFKVLKPKDEIEFSDVSSVDHHEEEIADEINQLEFDKKEAKHQ
jgi:hypothetical protein